MVLDEVQKTFHSFTLGSGGGSVGRAVASGTKSPRFETHWTTSLAGCNLEKQN